MGTDIITLIFYLRVPLLYFEYLNKRTVLEAEIFSVFISHLGLPTGKISLNSVRSIERMVRHFGGPFRATTPGGPMAKFFDENKNAPNIIKSIWIDSVFCADFKYIIFSITSLTIQEKIDQKSVKKFFFVSYSLFLLCFQYYSIV
jgi:hypothetical protein